MQLCTIHSTYYKSKQIENNFMQSYWNAFLKMYPIIPVEEDAANIIMINRWFL